MAAVSCPNPTSEAISRYLMEAKRRLAVNTVDSRRPLLKRVAAAHNGDLFGLTGEDIERWLDRAEVVTTTRNVYLSSLRAFYKWAMKRGYIDHNPAEDAERIKVPRGLPRPCRTDDLDRALAAAGPRMRAWLALMAYTGMRCCEVAAVHVEDLLWHLDPPMVHICHGTKGGNERVVPLARTVEEALLEFGLPRAGAVFRRPGSVEPISASYVSQKTRRYLDELDINATPHQLRHFFATSVYQQTGDLRAVQDMLGHASPATTAVYTRFSATDAAAVVRRLGEP